MSPKNISFDKKRWYNWKDKEILLKDTKKDPKKDKTGPKKGHLALFFHANKDLLPN